MAVLIKGMEMPQNCEECDVKVVCKNYWKLIRERYTIPSWCPLIELPPHGRLIDADALLNFLNHCMFPSDMVTTTALSMAKNWIKDAPTIIEAEEGET